MSVTGGVMVKRIVVWAGLVVMVLVAACGDDDADTATQPPATTQAATTTTEAVQALQPGPIAFRLLDAGKSGPFLERRVNVAAAIAELAAGFKGWGARSPVAPGVHGLEVDVEVMSGVFSSK